MVEYGFRRLILTIAVMCAALLETLDSTIVNVALPTIEGNLGASVDAGVWIVTGYIVSNVISIPLNPVLIARFGRKRYFSTCIIGFTVVSFLCSTAPSFWLLVLYRIFQGAFGGGLIATSQVVMRETFPPEQLGISSALFAIALLLGPALGPIAGGYLTDNASWQWIFDVNILPGSIAAAVVLAVLRDPPRPPKPAFDWFGIVWMIAALGGMQYVLDNGEAHDWFADPAVAAAAVLSITGFALFFTWVLRIARNPIVDFSVLRFRSVPVGMAMAFIFGSIVFVPAIIIPLFASNVLGYTSFQSGMLLLVRALPVVALTPITATLAQNGTDVRFFLFTGFSLTAVSLAVLSQHLTSAAGFGDFLWPLFFAGVAQSMLLVPLIVGVLSTTPAEENGRISPLITLCVQLGGSTSTAAAIAFFDRRSAFHDAIFRGSVTLARLSSHVPHAPGLATIARLIYREAATGGFADTLVAVAIIAGCFAPAVLLFPRSKAMEAAGE